MNTPGTNRDAQPASIDCTACHGAILVNDGRYHVDDRNYHLDCYDRLRADRIFAAGCCSTFSAITGEASSSPLPSACRMSSRTGP